MFSSGSTTVEKRYVPDILSGDRRNCEVSGVRFFVMAGRAVLLDECLRLAPSGVGNWRWGSGLPRAKKPRENAKSPQDATVSTFLSVVHAGRHVNREGRSHAHLTFYGDAAS